MAYPVDVSLLDGNNNVISTWSGLTAPTTVNVDNITTENGRIIVSGTAGSNEMAVTFTKVQ